MSADSCVWIAPQDIGLASVPARRFGYEPSDRNTSGRDGLVDAEHKPHIPLRTLILGAGGAFGGRLARLLAETGKFDLVLGGRSANRLEAVAAELRSEFHGARIETLAIDRDDRSRNTLAPFSGGLVIDAAGPFQGQDHHFAAAAIAARAHYLDLADARDFVLGFERLDTPAKRAAVTAISGASSVPALSSAVVADLARDLNVREISICIVPGAGKDWGRSVAQAILNQVGHTSERREAGEWRRVYVWQDLQHRVLRIGKKRPLTRLVSHCDAPDLDGFVRRYPNAETVTFHAGIDPGILHRGLWLLSFAVRWRWLASLAPFTDQLLSLARQFTRRKPMRGGMLVEVSGENPRGEYVRRCWTRIAPPGKGQDSCWH